MFVSHCILFVTKRFADSEACGNLERTNKFCCLHREVVLRGRETFKTHLFWVIIEIHVEFYRLCVSVCNFQLNGVSAVHSKEVWLVIAGKAENSKPEQPQVLSPTATALLLWRVQLSVSTKFIGAFLWKSSHSHSILAFQIFHHFIAFEQLYAVKEREPFTPWTLWPRVWHWVIFLVLTERKLQNIKHHLQMWK